MSLLFVPLLLASVAFAHPSAMRISTHSTLVQVDDDRVRVVYEVEVPLHTASDYSSLATPEELTGALLVRVDGQTVPMEVDELGGTVTGHVHHTRVKLHGPLPAPAQAVSVSIGSYPDSPAVFVWDAVLQRSLDVVSATTTGDGHERVLRPRAAQPGDGARELRLNLSDGGVPERIFEALTPDDPPYRSLKDAHPVSVQAVLTSSARSPGLFAGLFALAFALGLSGTAPSSATQRVTAAVFLAWLVLAMTAGTPPELAWLDLVGGVALAVAAPVLRSRPVALGVAGVAAVALLSTTARAGAAGFALWTAWGCGRALATRVPPGALNAVLGLVVTLSGWLLIARGAGELLSR